MIDGGEDMYSGYVKAKYLPQKMPMYQNNYRIAALPKYIEDKRELRDVLKCYPTVTKEELELSNNERMDLLEYNMNRFYVPREYDFELYEQLDRMMRIGYTYRNPLSYKEDSEQNYNSHTIKFDRHLGVTTSKALVILGDSGVGKSRFVYEFASLYPTVIEHTKYEDNILIELQIPVIMVEIPPNGSIKGMCLDILQRIDELLGEPKYRPGHQKDSVNDLMNKVRGLIDVHGVGILFIDEIQNLKGMKTEKPEALINFFLYITNQFKVPVVLVGTSAAKGLFDTTFRGLRRIGKSEPMKRFDNDVKWQAFVKKIFKIQYTKINVEPTEEMISCFYDLTQGITSFCKDIFIGAQFKAIQSGTEKITRGIMKQTLYEDYPERVEIIDALKNNKREILETYDDIMIDEQIESVEDLHEKENKGKAGKPKKKKVVKDDLLATQEKAKKMNVPVHESLLISGDIKKTGEFD